MSEVTICNRALTRVGEARITSLDDQTAAARLCKEIYPQVRDEELQSHPWNFARRRATLVALAQAPAFGWSAQYPLPDDYLRLLALNGVEVDQLSEEFEVEGYGDSDQVVLLCDADSAKIVYIKKVTDTSKFPPLFKKALSLSLAAEIATRIKDSQSLVESIIAERERISMPRARVVDARESRGRRQNVLVPWESRLINTVRS